MTQLTNHENQPFKTVNHANDSGCGCSTPRTIGDGNTETTPTDGNFTIDGKKIKFTRFDKNIVEVASREKITIPAPCYRSQQRLGCCGACVIEINGEKKYACNTIPESDMNIAVDREDLKKIRKEKLKEFKTGIKSGNLCECSGADATSCCG